MRFCSVLLVVALAAAVGMCGDTPWEVCANTEPPLGTLFFGLSPQGVADDGSGKNFIFSGQEILRRVTIFPLFKKTCHRGSTGSPGYFIITVKEKKFPIPDNWTAQKYDHIGDIDWDPEHNYIIAPLEKSWSWKEAALMLFDADTFEFVAARQTAQDHMPWASLWKSHSAIVTSEGDKTNTLMVYSYPFLDFIGKITLGYGELSGIQGGDVMRDPNSGHDILYLSTDLGKNPGGNSLFGFDLSTAELGDPTKPAELLFAQTVSIIDIGGEVEGITVLPAPSALSDEPTLWMVTNPITLGARIFTLRPTD